MALHKKVNKNGSITIPQQLRHELGIKAGVPLELTATAEGLSLTKYIPTCMVCGSAEFVVTLDGHCICKGCAEEVLRRCEAHGSDGAESTG